jgi:uncharacterized membrane protein
MMHAARRKPAFLKRHALGLISAAVVLTWITLYSFSDPKTHFGSFFGNAIADWTGVLVTVLATKHLYERGSAESRQPPINHPLRPLLEFLREHSLTVFLIVTGIGWVFAFRASDPESKWGQVIGNIVSEWTQILGLVLLTKRFFEVGSKESKR